MKLRLLFLLLFCTLISSNSYSQSVMDSLATDMCNCITNFSDSLSRKGQRVLSNAAIYKTYPEIEDAIGDHFFDEKEEEDNIMLERILGDHYEVCYDLINFKYKEFLKTIKSENEQEWLENFFERMSESSGCEVAEVIMRIVLE